jgi:ornithine cyclodeaminase/alanine dehydrogenase-like protein (mu-crystallin family)
MARFEKIAADEAADEGLTCSFCGKEPREDGDLIAGDQASICDECVAACVDVLARDDAAPDTDADPAEESDSGAEARHARRMPFRLLSEADVARLISIDDLIEPMETALRRFSSGQVVQPVRTVLPIGDRDAVFALMPVYGREPTVLGAKLVTVFNTNTALDVPTHLATVVLLNPETGALLAILGGTYITELRTAAVSAVSVNLLARDDAAILAIVGSGVQARSHLRAIEQAWELSDVRVWSPTPEHQEAFVDEMRSSTTARLESAPSAEDAVRGADLVVLATSSSEPVVESSWIRDGAHVISVGACRPEQREMDPALVKRGRLFVDSRAAALVESGDIVQGIHDRLFTPSHIVGELGELLDQKVEGRRSPRDVTIFKSLGLAVEDVFVAELAYQRAVAQGMGLELEL